MAKHPGQERSVSVGERDCLSDPKALTHDPEYETCYEQHICVLTGRVFGLIITRRKRFSNE